MSLPKVYRYYDLLFTPHLIPALRRLRGPEWADLIGRLSVLPETHPDALALAMMVIDLGGCLSCQMDSYRAQKGCALCAHNTIVSFKGADSQLLKRYEAARQQVALYLAEEELAEAA
jgi:hypothetical protein